MSYPSYDQNEQERPVTAYDAAVSGQLQETPAQVGESAPEAPAWPSEVAPAEFFPIASSEDLLRPEEVETYVVQIPEIRRAVRVRALTRAETLELRKLGELDLAELERRLLTHALVEPKMTHAQVKTWYDAQGATTLTPVVDKVLQVSGLVTQGKDALKAGMKSVRD